VSVRLSVCLSVCPIYRPLQQRAAGLLQGAPQAGNIDRQRRTPISNGATAARRTAARRWAANAASGVASSRRTLTYFKRFKYFH